MELHNGLYKSGKITVQSRPLLELLKQSINARYNMYGMGFPANEELTGQISTLS